MATARESPIATLATITGLPNRALGLYFTDHPVPIAAIRGELP
jgi:hypothetical protein